MMSVRQSPRSQLPWDSCSHASAHQREYAREHEGGVGPLLSSDVLVAQTQVPVSAFNQVRQKTVPGALSNADTSSGSIRLDGIAGRGHVGRHQSQILSSVAAVSLSLPALAGAGLRCSRCGWRLRRKETHAAHLEDATRGFYVALNDVLGGDVAPVLAVWSHADDVTYMSPFGELLVGWEPVRAYGRTGRSAARWASRARRAAPLCLRHSRVRRRDRERKRGGRRRCDCGRHPRDEHVQSRGRPLGHDWTSHRSADLSLVTLAPKEGRSDVQLGGRPRASTWLSRARFDCDRQAPRGPRGRASTNICSLVVGQTCARRINPSRFARSRAGSISLSSTFNSHATKPRLADPNSLTIAIVSFAPGLGRLNRW